MTLKLPENPTQHIKPSRPTVGEEIVVGVGFLRLEDSRYIDSFPELVVAPRDHRDRFWLDPRILYRLHDQTVEVYVEEVEVEPLPVTDLIDDYQEGKVYITPPDGQSIGVQTRMTGILKVKPNIERLGPGLFSVKGPSSDDPPGTTYDLAKE